MVVTPNEYAESIRTTRYERGVPSKIAWIEFAALMLGLAGFWNVIQGILAIGNSKVYVGNAEYVFSDLKTWGWIMVGLGALQLLAVPALIRGSQLARWFGIVIAGVNAFGQLAFLSGAPFWALTMFAVDMLIIYALTVYGGDDLRRE